MRECDVHGGHITEVMEMKKIKLGGRLSLKTETLVRLSDDDLERVKGGNQNPDCTCSCGACNSSPQNPATCQGKTCINLDGCY